MKTNAARILDDLGIRYELREYDFDESDLSAVRNGFISVTPLHLDLTHEATRRKLAAGLEKA